MDLITFLLLLLLLSSKKVGSAKLRESDVHTISPKTPAPQYQPIDRKKRKGKILEDYNNDRAAYANERALVLPLKPVGPTPSNTGSARPFQRYTYRETKVLGYCEVLQWGGAYVLTPMCDRAPLFTRFGTYSAFSPSSSWYIGLHLILYSRHTDRRWAMSQSTTPPVRSWAPLTARFSSLRCVSAAEDHTA